MRSCMGVPGPRVEGVRASQVGSRGGEKGCMDEVDARFYSRLAPIE